MQADAPRRLQPFRVEDRLHLSEAGVRILVDQHIILFSPLADLARRALHPARDHHIAVRAPAAQPSLPPLHLPRQDEYADDVGINLLQLLPPLPVDIDQSVVAAFYGFSHLLPGFPIVPPQTVRPST